MAGSIRGRALLGGMLGRLAPPVSEEEVARVRGRVASRVLRHDRRHRAARRRRGAWSDPRRRSVPAARMTALARCGRASRGGGGPRGISDIQRELLEAVGVSVSEVRDEEVLASVWRSWLANRKILLILDDAPDESSVRMLLPGSAASRVLITSRSRLSGLESVVRVGLGELSAHPTALKLLVAAGESFA